MWLLLFRSPKPVFCSKGKIVEQIKVQEELKSMLSDAFPVLQLCQNCFFRFRDGHTRCMAPVFLVSKCVFCSL